MKVKLKIKYEIRTNVKVKVKIELKIKVKVEIKAKENVKVEVKGSIFNWKVILKPKVIFKVKYVKFKFEFKGSKIEFQNMGEIKE